MKAAKLIGPKRMIVRDEPDPGSAGPGDVLLRVGAVGICGSDLHMYGTGAIGYTRIESPFTLGHEFMGTVLEVGEGSHSGFFEELVPGQRVAVEPAVPCLHCEVCEAGNPNLCPHHRFFGVYPSQGALCEKMLVPARNCFPIPDEISEGGGTLLETLGVAIHAIDLAKVKIGDSVAVIGCGPVGLLILKLALLSGARAVYAFDKFAWRTAQAESWGATASRTVQAQEGVEFLHAVTKDRGVDVVLEAAWADESVDQSMEMAAYGGRVVLVGIPPDDRAQFSHSMARRKGLTIRMARRMKHTYSRAIGLASGSKPFIPFDELISEQVGLDDAPVAFARNYAYEEGVQKIIIKT